MEIGKVNLYAGNSVGVDEKNIVKFDIEVLNENVFKVTPVWLLEPGEYCFYYQGIVPVGGYSNQAVFDFSIPYNAKFELLANPTIEDKKGKFVWVYNNGKSKMYVIVECRRGKNELYYGLAKNEDSPVDFFVKESECYNSKKELKQALGLE